MSKVVCVLSIVPSLAPSSCATCFSYFFASNISVYEVITNSPALRLSDRNILDNQRITHEENANRTCYIIQTSINKGIFQQLNVRQFVPKELHKPINYCCNTKNIRQLIVVFNNMILSTAKHQQEEYRHSTRIIEDNL